jgi:hypothetical protein
MNMCKMAFHEAQMQSYVHTTYQIRTRMQLRSQAANEKKEKKWQPNLNHFGRRCKRQVPNPTKETRERNKKKIKQESLPSNHPPIPFRPPYLLEANQRFGQ